ncbi:hypothetical protein ABK040_006682 [Willaertia magna]
MGNASSSDLLVESIESLANNDNNSTNNLEQYVDINTIIIKTKIQYFLQNHNYSTVISDSILDFISEPLGNVDQLKQTYLDPDWRTTSKMFQIYENLTQKAVSLNITPNNVNNITGISMNNNNVTNNNSNLTNNKSPVMNNNNNGSSSNNNEQTQALTTSSEKKNVLSILSSKDVIQEEKIQNENLEEIIITSSFCSPRRLKRRSCSLNDLTTPELFNLDNISNSSSNTNTPHSPNVFVNNNNQSPSTTTSNNNSNNTSSSSATSKLKKTLSNFRKVPALNLQQGSISPSSPSLSARDSKKSPRSIFGKKTTSFEASNNNSNTSLSNNTSINNTSNSNLSLKSPRHLNDYNDENRSLLGRKNSLGDLLQEHKQNHINSPILNKTIEENVLQQQQEENTLLSKSKSLFKKIGSFRNKRSGSVNNNNSTTNKIKEEELNDLYKRFSVENELDEELKQLKLEYIESIQLKHSNHYCNSHHHSFDNNNEKEEEEEEMIPNSLIYQNGISYYLMEMDNIETFNSLPYFTQNNNYQQEKLESIKAMLLHKNNPLEGYLSVKLVLLDNNLLDFISLKEILSPIKENLFTTKFIEKFKCGILIGSWLLCWDESNLIIPTKVIEPFEQLTVDVGVLHVETNVEEVLMNLCNFIIEWNTTRYFKQPSGCEEEGIASSVSSSQLNNTTSSQPLQQQQQSLIEHRLNLLMKQLQKQQNENLKFTGATNFDFVFELLNCLNIKLNLEDNPSMRRLFSNIRKYGYSTLEFINDDYNNIKEFKTHNELDEFIHQLVSHNNTFSLQRPLDWELLKCYDRLFWMKHLRYPLEENLQPNYLFDTTINCYFKHPYLL